VGDSSTPNSGMDISGTGNIFAKIYGNSGTGFRLRARCFKTRCILHIEIRVIGFGFVRLLFAGLYS
jgi:hypothetical protein